MPGICAIALVMLIAIAPFTGSTRAQTSDVPPVIIDYFYEAGCPDCYRVRDQILPVLDVNLLECPMRWHAKP